MKKLVFKTGMILILAILFASTNIVFGQTAEKEISKEYKISEGYTLGIDNQYGEINFVNWDKNELAVVVRIEAEASTQSKADGLLNKVSIDIEEGNNSVYFDTEIEKLNMTGKTKLRVIYSVKAPAYLNVDLEQSYGSIFLQDVSGEANIEVKYGNLTANSLVSNSEEWNTLELKYSDASIETVGSLSAEIKYSEIMLSESQELSLESAYSKIFLGEVGGLDLESKYDKVAMDQLNGYVNVESAYTQVKLGFIKKGFTSIEADMSYGNLKGELEEGAYFSIEAETAYGSIDIPDGDYEFEKDGTKQEVSGRVGGASDSEVYVSIRYGNLSLK
jgi:hypothetical protein